MELELGIWQKQWICRERIQCAAVLQMSVRELGEYLDEVLLENPLARWEKPAPPSAVQSSWERAGASEDTLQAQLLEQLGAYKWNAEEVRICRYLICSLDQDGYFREDISETAVQLGAAPDAVEACLAKLKNFDPPGVFARDLAECLVLQLQRLDADVEPEIQIVEQCLELLGKNRLDRVAEKLALSAQRVQQAQERIRSLNPRPAAGMAAAEPTVYATPDVAVDAAGTVRLNQDACPARSCRRRRIRKPDGICGKKGSNSACCRII